MQKLTMNEKSILLDTILHGIYDLKNIEDTNFSKEEINKELYINLLTGKYENIPGNYNISKLSENLSPNDIFEELFTYSLAQSIKDIKRDKKPNKEFVSPSFEESMITELAKQILSEEDEKIDLPLYCKYYQAIKKILFLDVEQNINKFDYLRPVLNENKRHEENYKLAKTTVEDASQEIKSLYKIRK